MLELCEVACRHIGLHWDLLHWFYPAGISGKCLYPCLKMLKDHFSDPQHQPYVHVQAYLIGWKAEEVIGEDPLHPLSHHDFNSCLTIVPKFWYADMGEKGEIISVLLRYLVPETSCLLPLSLQKFPQSKWGKTIQGQKYISLLFSSLTFSESGPRSEGPEWISRILKSI